MSDDNITAGWDRGVEQEAVTGGHRIDSEGIQAKKAPAGLRARDTVVGAFRQIRIDVGEIGVS